MEKEVQEALIADSAQVQEELTALTIHNEEFTELKADHVKLQEQLQCVIEEMNLLRQNLKEREQELGVLKHIMAQEKVLLDELGHRNETLQQQHSNEEKERLNKVVQAGKVRIKELWRINCEQLTEFDQILLIKEEELQSLRNLLQSRPVSEFSSCVTWPNSRSSVTQPLCSTSSVSRILTSVNEALPRVSVVNLPVVSTTMSRVSHNVTLTHSVPTLLSVNSTSRPPSQSLSGISLPTSQQTQGTMGTRTTASQSLELMTQTIPVVTMPPTQRHGKAPPVDSFTAEDPEVRFDDWLPTLERETIWNGWSGEETLMQLAGYLRNKALQESNLLSQEHRNTFEAAVKALRARLDSGNQTLAALDFRHAVQKDSEAVADYIRCLERTFQMGFGRDKMSAETRNVPAAK